MFTANTMRRLTETPRTRVNRNVRTNVRATAVPVEKDVTKQNKNREVINKSI